jgi:hypothetical protein
MLKVTVAVLAVALASTASAGGWRSLRLDATSEAAFEQSVALFQDKLSPSRRHAFARALQDIWTEGVLQASGVYTRADYFARLNGLAYEEVVTLLDPTGEKAHQYRAEYYATRVDRGNQRATWSGSETPWPPSGGPPPVQNGEYRGATRSIDRQTH